MNQTFGNKKFIEFPAYYECTSITTFKDRYEKGEINLDPSYQRGEVWNREKQSKLIHSIVNNVAIPPLVFSEVIKDEKMVWNCIDGKQRTISIMRFLDDEIPYVNEENKKIYYSSLTEFDKYDFQGKPIMVVKYRRLSHKQEVKIFELMQLGAPLVPAEKLNAIDSKTKRLVAEIGQKYGFTQKMDFRREKGSRIIISMLFILCNPFNLVTDKKLINFMVHDYDQIDINKVHKVFGKLEDAFIYDSSIFDQLSPIEYIYCTLIASNMLERSADCIGMYIHRMKKLMLEKFPGERKNNSNVSNFLLNFVKEIVKEAEIVGRNGRKR